MMKFFLPAAVLSLLICSAASAGPLPSTSGIKQGGESVVTKVQAKRKKDARPRRPDKRRFVPGRRYRTAPPGYRRYTVRPRDWRTRGCIIVGPLWFCP